MFSIFSTSLQYSEQLPIFFLQLQLLSSTVKCKINSVFEILFLSIKKQIQLWFIERILTETLSSRYFLKTILRVLLVCIADRNILCSVDIQYIIYIFVYLDNRLLAAINLLFANIFFVVQIHLLQIWNYLQQIYIFC